MLQHFGSFWRASFEHHEKSTRFLNTRGCHRCYTQVIRCHPKIEGSIAQCRIKFRHRILYLEAQLCMRPLKKFCRPRCFHRHVAIYMRSMTLSFSVNIGDWLIRMKYIIKAFKSVISHTVLHVLMMPRSFNTSIFCTGIYMYIFNLGVTAHGLVTNFTLVRGSR